MPRQHKCGGIRLSLEILPKRLPIFTAWAGALRPIAVTTMRLLMLLSSLLSGLSPGG